MFSLNNINILVIYLCSSSLFLVTVKGWSSFILITSAFICFYHVFLRKNMNLINPNSKENETILKFVLSAPLVAILISSIIRNNFRLQDLDGPVRFVLVIPIYLYIKSKNINIARYFFIIIPLSLIITLIHQYAFTQPMLWGTDRMSTYFSDPLVFGYTALTLALMCLTIIMININLRTWIKILNSIGFVIGIYLALKSGSRTGWLVFPFVLLFLYMQNRYKNKTIIFIGIILITILSILYFYLTSSSINSRINFILSEISNYSLNGLASENSIGFRLTFIRIAYDLFLIQPFSGYGDIKAIPITIPSEIHTYATDKAIYLATQSGFHNEIITNSIRSGIFGFLSSLAIFFYPLILFFKSSKSEDLDIRTNASLGFVFVISIFFSSLSTEVFDLKYTISFYATTIALLLGSILKVQNLKTH